MTQDTTIDGLLDSRIKLEQPAKGFRVAIDTVLLAAAVPARSGQSALDLGCGVGGATLCLATRVPDLKITGVEFQRELAELCRANITRNGFSDLNVIHADVTALPPDLNGTFDHVFMNPPYHQETRHDVSPQAIKKIANTEKHGDLSLWITSASRALKPDGMLTIIHRADRSDEILQLLQADFGAVEVLAIQAKPEGAPKRILIRTSKGSSHHVANCVNFVLHQADGRYTDEAEGILRHMKLLPFRKAE